MKKKEMKKCDNRRQVNQNSNECDDIHDATGTVDTFREDERKLMMTHNPIQWDELLIDDSCHVQFTGRFDEKTMLMQDSSFTLALIVTQIFMFEFHKLTKGIIIEAAVDSF